MTTTQTGHRVAAAALAAIVAAWPVFATAQQTPAASAAKTTTGPERAMQIKPVMLDSSKGGGATLGLEYTYERKWAASGATDDAGKPDFDFENVALWDRLVEVRGEGTIAVSRQRNPNKLLDLAANARYDYQRGGWSSGVGGSLKAETDQGFDNRQLVYALQARGFLNNPLGGKGWALVYLNVGRVEPNADAVRKQALGNADPKGFQRWDSEIIYHKDLKISISKLTLKSIEFQYRHYQELSAPASIRQSGLDRFRLGTVRLNAGDDYFVAYSRGRLPFDRQSDRSVKIGWSYKFE